MLSTQVANSAARGDCFFAVTAVAVVTSLIQKRIFRYEAIFDARNGRNTIDFSDPPTSSASYQVSDVRAAPANSAGMIVSAARLPGPCLSSRSSHCCSSNRLGISTP